MVFRASLAFVACILLGVAGASGATVPKLLPPGATLAVEVPAQTRWRSDLRIPVLVTAKAAEARGISVASGSFLDPKGPEPLQVDFCLAEKVDADCASLASLPADSPRQLWLVGTGSAKAGSYAGSIRLTASSGHQGNASMTLNVTTARWRYLGLAALVLGVVLSFYLSVWLPHQRARELAILPFARLAEELELVRKDIDTVSAPNTRKEADALMVRLHPLWLEKQRLIPSRWPSPAAATNDAEAFRINLVQSQSRLSAIQLLVRNINAAKDAAIKTQLDGLADEPGFPQDNLADRIEAIMVQTFAARQGPSFLTPAVIIYREEVRNLIYWVLSSVFAVLLGFVLVIDSNPSFGGWDDVAAALLWALGIATAGTTLSVASLRGALRA